MSSCNSKKDQLLSKALEQSNENSIEISKAIAHYPKTSLKSKAMYYLISNMIDRESCNNEVMDFVKEVLKKETDLNKIWRETLRKFPEQKKSYDLSKVKSSYLINNIEDSYNAWKTSSWHNEIDFTHYCDYILPYNILDEPIVEWRKYLKSKYFFLVKDCKTQKEAFFKVNSYFLENFKTSSEYVPYENDVLLLESLMKGDCKARTLLITYVMRALGICAAFDYSPVWANCSNNSHSWVAMVTNENKVCLGQTGSFIEGSYEKIKYELPQDYAYHVDSLKRISKIYRKSFQKYKVDNNAKLPLYINSPNDIDVTKQYPNITTQNIIKVKPSFRDKLYVCTYKQQVGWVPVGVAKRVSYNKVDIGGVFNDCVVIVAKYQGEVLKPISFPHIISHSSPPKELKMVSYKHQNIKLYRKYMLSSRWINRWGDIIGTTVETSNSKMFDNNLNTLYNWNKLPTEETCIQLKNADFLDYLRILPHQCKYPVFAEIKLIDFNNKEIPHYKFKLYSIGEGLTGDSAVVKSLTDNNEMTTFYKQFPFWIGIDIKKCKNEISALKLILWNDVNRILKNHTYELFYYNNGWESLGKKKATAGYLNYNNVPVGCLFLLRDYTAGKEERIFEYKDGKQIWW